MTKEQKRRLPIKHIGDVLAICDGKTKSYLREDLGYKRYKQLGVRERFRNEPPYRICSRCLAIERGKENRSRSWTGLRPLIRPLK